ncbi:MAG: hypothetical protein QXP04_00960, partial [Candidatus Nanoarchaeia archaeon]|nr:hypothetical protein [Candidatus Jingweiarchaeum tengchongense]
ALNIKNLHFITDIYAESTARNFVAFCIINFQFSTSIFTPVTLGVLNKVKARTAWQNFFQKF